MLGNAWYKNIENRKNSNGTAITPNLSIKMLYALWLYDKNQFIKLLSIGQIILIINNLKTTR